MRASDFRISLSQGGTGSPVTQVVGLQEMTFMAAGVVRSIGGGKGSWQMTSSWMNLPRLTMELSAGSDADHRKLGWLSIPMRFCAAGQVALTNVVLLAGAPLAKARPGNSVASFLLT